MLEQLLLIKIPKQVSYIFILPLKIQETGKSGINAETAVKQPCREIMQKMRLDQVVKNQSGRIFLPIYRWKGVLCPTCLWGYGRETMLTAYVPGCRMEAACDF